MTDPSASVGIASVGTANPGIYVRQSEALAALESLFELEPREQVLYRRLLSNGPIQGRYLAMDRVQDAVIQDQDQLIERYTRFAVQAATEAGRKALGTAGIRAEDLGGLVVNTCTGYLCPGLTSYLAEELGTGSRVETVDLVGMGCGGAIPNLRLAARQVRSHPHQPVLSVAVEICSATLFMDPDPGIIVSNSIFGDGAAACVVQSAATRAGRGHLCQLLAFESGLYPRHRETLRYRTERHQLRNVLKPEVPAVAAETVCEVVDRLLRQAGLEKRDVSSWMIHPGGTRVLQALQDSLQLNENDLLDSYQVLSQYGNMSSPSVLFVLETFLSRNSPVPGSYGALVGFGAGFSVFAALVEF